jgi:hypothetical protein
VLGKEVMQSPAQGPVLLHTEVEEEVLLQLFQGSLRQLELEEQEF